MGPYGYLTAERHVFDAAVAASEPKRMVLPD